MRSKINIETTVLQSGETLEKSFDNYVEMAEHAVDWTLFCSYQLKPNFSEGIYKILQLPSMQIVYTDMQGGIMFDYVSPEECITFSVMKNISEKACLSHIKLETNLISVIDDKHIYNFICSERVELLDVSLNKDADPLLLEQLLKAVDKYYMDSDQSLAVLLCSVIDEYAEISQMDEKTSIEIEAKITRAMLEVLDTQEAQVPRLTKSERIALQIKSQLFKHMDHTMTVASLAKSYNISIKSLQNSFKSLFGLKPNQYMRLLKLNLVHHELLKSNSSDTSVMRVAQKWGFVHMGRLSHYYRELFGENPSVTLKTSTSRIDGMKVHCVERKEEIL
jgi:AraC-like DNA-binding protein